MDMLAVAGYGLLGTVFALNAAVVALAERNYRRLRELPAEETKTVPSVEVIIPARNESAIIGRVVRSLVGLEYPNLTVTVVDDQSTDGTGEIATREGARVRRITDLPSGWTGKCNACDTAARESRAEWLLFTDADTWHAPNSLCRAIGYAEANRLDAVSLLLRQECETFWEKLALPMAYQNYFSALNPTKPAFNGQYILMRRSAYERSGGFGAVRGRVMEDVALANHLVECGYRIDLLNGHSAASVRMYRNLIDLLRGMTKTAFTAARDRGWLGWLVALPFFFGMLTVPIGVVGTLAGQWALVAFAAGIVLFIAAGLVAWNRRFGVPPLYALLNQIGVGLFFFVGMVSTTRAITGRGVRWKGRTIVETR
jgi:chlorobactene glucosyltransferase